MATVLRWVDADDPMSRFSLVLTDGDADQGAVYGRVIRLSPSRAMWRTYWSTGGDRPDRGVSATGGVADGVAHVEALVAAAHPELTVVSRGVLA